MPQASHLRATLLLRSRLVTIEALLAGHVDSYAQQKPGKNSEDTSRSPSRTDRAQSEEQSTAPMDVLAVLKRGAHLR